MARVSDAILYADFVLLMCVALIETILVQKEWHGIKEISTLAKLGRGGLRPQIPGDSRTHQYWLLG
jgi:hypothetical protein